MRSLLLQDLLAHSVRRGHARVALQRLMMLQARGEPVPDELRRRCEAHRARLPPREVARMAAAAAEWASMVSGRDARWTFPLD